MLGDEFDEAWGDELLRAYLVDLDAEAPAAPKAAGQSDDDESDKCQPKNHHLEV